MDHAVREWARQTAQAHPEIIRIGYFGSYARGDWGVGSDLDLILIVERTGESFERRALGFDFAGLPVPAEALVYTQAEWDKMAGTRFGRTVRAEAVWV